jgi:HSP90 family molecular chaperone
MNQTIVALKTENIELSNQLDKQASLIQKLTTDKNQLVLKNKNKFETIERLQADVKRLEEAKEANQVRSKEAEKARAEAVKEVIKLASENTELRSKLEAESEPVSTTENEQKTEPVDTTEPEQNDSKKEPKNKFTLDKAHERFIELKNKFPDKKQSELIRILDSEGYKNSKGKRLVPSTISRWHEEWEKKAKAGKK